MSKKRALEPTVCINPEASNVIPQFLHAEIVGQFLELVIMPQHKDHVPATVRAFLRVRNEVRGKTIPVGQPKSDMFVYLYGAGTAGNILRCSKQGDLIWARDCRYIFYGLDTDNTPRKNGFASKNVTNLTVHLHKSRWKSDRAMENLNRALKAEMQEAPDDRAERDDDPFGGW